MNESSIRRIGSLIMALQLHRLSRVFLPRNNVRIAYTHHIFAEDVENFEGLIKYAASKRKVISPKDFFDSYEKKLFRGDFLLFTFDDGLLSSYRAAKKILSKYGIKAVFFVPTAILDFKTEDQMKEFAVSKVYFGRRKADSFRREEYVTMSREQLIDLYNEGHMVFPHTHSHCRLTEIKDETGIQEEIVRPKELLEDLLGCRINSFAFPVGTERVVSPYAYSKIKELYQFCFTGLGGVNSAGTDRHFLHRDCLHAHFTFKHARNVFDGVYDGYYLYKMSLLKKAAC